MQIKKKFINITDSMYLKMTSFLLAVLYLATFSLTISCGFSKKSEIYQWHEITTTCITNCSCVKREGVVVKANCSSRGLFSVPPALPSTLEVLDISKNNIKSLVSSSFVQLHRLVRLDASFNAIAYLFKCMLPDNTSIAFPAVKPSKRPLNNQETSCDFEGMVTLKEWVQGDNREATKLRTTADEMSFSLASELSQFSNMTQLEKVNLHSNLISHLPSGIFTNNKKLKSLDLSSNALTRLLPLTFIGLSSLTYLSLRKNTLRYVDGTFANDSFLGLSALTELDLHTNQPYGSYSPDSTYPDAALSKVPSLEILRIDGIPSTFRLGSGFRALTNLSLLDMSHTPDPNNPQTDYCVINDLLDDYFINIKTDRPLTVLLRKCHVYRVHPRTFTSLPTLHSLSLRDNHQMKFDGLLIVSESFPNTSLKHLDISNIDSDYTLNLDPKYFKYLSQTSLETLIMEYNRLIGIDPGVFFKLHITNIKKLSLALNELLKTEFFPSLRFLTKMEILNISSQRKVSVSKLTSNVPVTLSVSRNLTQPKLGNQSFPGYSDYGLLTEENSEFHPHFSILAQEKNRGTKKSKSNPSVKDLDKRARATTDQSQDQPRLSLAEADKLNRTEFSLLIHSFCPPGFKSLLGERNIEGETDTIIISRPNKLHEMSNILQERNVSNHFYIDISKFLKGSKFGPIPRNLKQFYASDLKLGLNIPKGGLSKNVVEILDLSKNFLWCIDGPVSGVDTIQVLDLSENYCLALSQHFFDEWPELRTLYLNVNVLGPSLEVDVESVTFSKLYKLEYIDLSFNSIRILHEGIFKNTKQLKSIILKNNSMQAFHPKIAHLNRLELLDLSHNELHKLSSQNREDLDQISKTSALIIDLRDNALLCDCSSLHFLSWFLATNVTFLYKEDYTCTHKNGSDVSVARLGDFIDSLWRECFSQLLLIVTLICFICMVFIMIACGVVLYYKNVLYFYYYISSKRYFRNMAYPERYGVKDVFVVYDDQEIRWRRFVARVLKERLESRGVSCHFSEVDGYGPGDEPTAGRTTRDVIEDSVLKTKKTLVLLTKDVFLFEEQELEVNMAKVCEDMRDSKVLIFLELERFPPALMPKHIQKIVQKNKPLAFGGDRDEFWDQLVQRIRSDQ